MKTLIQWLFVWCFGWTQVHAGEDVLVNQGVVLQPQDILMYEGFFLGASAAINSGQTHMVIGSPREDTQGHDSGAAYLFEKINGQWVELARLLPPIQGQVLNFAIDVSISDQWVVVGMAPASIDSQMPGKVFVYDLTGHLYATLESGINGDDFGSAVDLKNNTLLVGARGDDSAVINSGVVHVFQFNTNTQMWEASLIPHPSPQALAFFGTSVALNDAGDQALVAASHQDVNGINNAGMAYLLGLDQGVWNVTHTFESSNPVPNAYFGYRLAMGDNLIAFNSGMLDQDPANDTVEVFEWQQSLGWAHAQTLQDEGNDDLFGLQVALKPGQLAVAQNNGVQFFYQDGPGNWLTGEHISPIDLGVPGISPNMGRSGMQYVADQLMLNHIQNGVVLISQQPITSVESGGICQLPGECNWVFDEQVNRLNIADSSVGDQLGVSVDVSGNLAVIGVYLDDDMGENAGAAYLMEYKAFGASAKQWYAKAKLYASDGAAGDWFGREVAIDGNRLVVGAPLADTFVPGVNINAPDTGRVYVFEEIDGQWVEIQAINSDEEIEATGDRFGFAVDLTDSRLAIGAYLDDEADQDAGAVYTYDWTGMGFQIEDKLLASDGMAGDGFGYDLSLDGNRLLVGAYLHDQLGQDVGAAYVFQHVIPPINGWIQQQKLLPSGPTVHANDVFGAAVSLSGDMAVVGAPKSENSAVTDDDLGAAFVYLYDDGTSQWNSVQTLRARNGQLGAQFGRSLALEGERLLVGAWLMDYQPPTSINIPDAGMAHFYRWNPVGGLLHQGAWELGAELVARIYNNDDNFGQSVAVAGELLLVGAHRDNGFDDSGSVTAFVDDLIFTSGME